jgi:hypothetical protein
MIKSDNINNIKIFVNNILVFDGVNITTSLVFNQNDKIKIIIDRQTNTEALLNLIGEVRNEI